MRAAPLRSVGGSSVPGSVARTAGEYPIIASDPNNMIRIAISINMISIGISINMISIGISINSGKIVISLNMISIQWTIKPYPTLIQIILGNIPDQTIPIEKINVESALITLSCLFVL